MGYQWGSPQTPLWDQIRGWFLEALDRAGNEARMGLALYGMFLRAELPEPHAVLAAFVGAARATRPRDGETSCPRRSR